MTFQPSVNQELSIDGTLYRIAEHPAARGVPYGQEGRQATVYCLVGPDGEQRAVKVFKSRFRVPSMVSLAKRLAFFADLPGLSVCRRTVLTPQHHSNLLRCDVESKVCNAKLIDFASCDLGDLILLLP